MRRRHSSRPVAPFLMTARFSSICPETGRQIHAGDQIAYFPETRRAYHSESRAANQLREQLFAKSWQMADANW